MQKIKPIVDNEDVGILYHDKTTNLPNIVPVSKWNALKSEEQIADGIAIRNGEEIMIVATNYKQLHWNDNTDVIGVSENNFYNSFVDKEIDYLDPFDVRKEW